MACRRTVMVRRLRTMPSRMSARRKAAVDWAVVSGRQAVDAYPELFRHGSGRKLLGVLLAPVAAVVYGGVYLVFRFVSWLVTMMFLAGMIGVAALLCGIPTLAIFGVARALGLTGPSSSQGARGDSGASFCDTHDCISSFDDGSGSIVQCADGSWSHSGGRGACSRHGGES